MKLSKARDYKIGSKFEILSFVGEELLKERLHEMGLRQGLTMEFRGSAPLGGPMIFNFKTTSLALRSEEADCLEVKLA